MVAELTLKHGKVRLEDDGVWTSERADFAKTFNFLFGKDTIPPTPSAGSSPYANQARKAVELSGAKVEWAPAALTEPGIVY